MHVDDAAALDREREGDDPFASPPVTARPHCPSGRRTGHPARAAAGHRCIGTTCSRRASPSIRSRAKTPARIRTSRNSSSARCVWKRCVTLRQPLVPHAAAARRVQTLRPFNPTPCPLLSPTASMVPFIPESAPFTEEQRQWLNGFLAGLFSEAPSPATGGMEHGSSPAPESPRRRNPSSSCSAVRRATPEGLAKEGHRRSAQTRPRADVDRHGQA